jgi:hypothetical protein
MGAETRAEKRSPASLASVSSETWRTTSTGVPARTTRGAAYGLVEAATTAAARRRRIAAKITRCMSFSSLVR